MPNPDRTAEARKLYNKINRRAKRLIESGQSTSALGKFLQIDRLQRGEQASGAYLRKLKSLDKAAGLRASGAKSTVISETRQLNRVMSAAYRSTATSAMLRRATDLAQNVLSARVATVRNVIDDTSHLQKVSQTVRSIKPATNSTQSALRVAAAAASKMLKYESLTPEGAERGMDSARDVFGSVYDEWTPEQRSAAWLEFSKQKESLGSFQAMEEIGTASRMRSVQFSKNDDGELIASIGDTPEDSAKEAARKESHEQVMRRIRTEKTSPERQAEIDRKTTDFFDMVKKNNARIARFRF